MRKISLCVTHLNRLTLLQECIAQVLDDERVSEIIISDDASDADVYKQLTDYYKPHTKVKIHTNYTRLGTAANKAKAVSLASNKWVILFDSDNVMSREYIDTLYSISTWVDTIIYAPDFSAPHFDYRQYSGHIISKYTVSNYLGKKNFDALMNTINFFVHRGQYLKNYVEKTDVLGADGIWYFYNWLKNGNTYMVVPGLQYFHRVHDGSLFLNTVAASMKQAKEIEKLVGEL